MSNFPLSYRLSWLPRFLNPSTGGEPVVPAALNQAPAPPRGTVRLAFVGDISAVHGPKPPDIDEELGALLGSADIVVGNCESPVVAAPRARLGTAIGTRHAMPAAFLAVLADRMRVERGRMVLSLANNHALDQGIRGFDETLAALDRLGIRTIGTVRDGPVSLVDAGPLKVGLAAFTQWRNVGAELFSGRIEMLEGARARGWQGIVPAEADIVCAVAHWDWEFRHLPRAGTRALAAELAAAGVRLIAGHHAHVLQPAERIGDTVCAYGLGDFLGTAWSRQPWSQRIGGIFVADIHAEGARSGYLSDVALVPFFRGRAGGAERLMPIDRLDGSLRGKVEARLSAVIGAGRS